MKTNGSIDAVKEIMLQFASITGLAESGGAPRRYLWTDAFAVCNYLELYRQSGDEKWRELAVRLVDQVHHVLGRHRPDSSHSGWLSGLSEEEGEQHPTRAGLRIGKPLGERLPEEFPDERLEWDRDGQYYHYLTKWMHALNRMSGVTGDERYLRWAIELAKAAHQGFSYTSPAGEKRLYWKMSIDLSRPQALAMGQHDPLDGLVTCWELQAAARHLPGGDLPALATEIGDLAVICRGREWATDDTLGIGGLLWSASAVAQLTAHGEVTGAKLLQELLEGALFGLDAVSSSGQLELAGRFRLAFRELGLSIGLKAVEPITALVEQETARFDERLRPLKERLRSINRHLALGDRIASFWLTAAGQQTSTWHEHREINMVMLATSMAPEEFLKT